MIPFWFHRNCANSHVLTVALSWLFNWKRANYKEHFYELINCCNKGIHNSFITITHTHTHTHTHTYIYIYIYTRNKTLKCKGKVTCTLVQALRLCTGPTARRESRGIALLFRDHGTRRGWGVSVTSRPLFTPGKTRYPLYRRMVGSMGGLDRCGKSRPPPGVDPRTVQAVAIRYTNWATRPMQYNIICVIYIV